MMSWPRLEGRKKKKWKRTWDAHKKKERGKEEQKKCLSPPRQEKKELCWDSQTDWLTDWLGEGRERELLLDTEVGNNKAGIKFMQPEKLTWAMKAASQPCLLLKKISSVTWQQRTETCLKSCRIWSDRSDISRDLCAKLTTADVIVIPTYSVSFFRDIIISIIIVGSSLPHSQTTFFSFP